MKTTPIILLFTFLLMLFTTCENTSPTADVLYDCPMQCEGDKDYNKSGNCPVCEMKLTPIKDKEEKILADPNYISDASIFNLTSTWKTQNNEEIELKDLKGEILVVTMIYTTCKAACPRLVADMRHIFEKVAHENINFVLVSIDPENDTPEVLKAFAAENQLEDEFWTLLTSTEDNVREFSNVLSMKYKRISPLDFSHSNIITVFNEQGELYFQQEGLGVDNTKLVEHINELK